MPKLKPDALPSYRLHKQSGQAIVTLSGRDILLGPHGTKASRDAYDRHVAEWISNGRRWSGQDSDLSVGELIVQFWEFAEKYFGKESGELSNFRYALRPLRKLYADTPAAGFGPLKLKTVREEMVRQGRSRRYINHCVSRIKRVFKWGVENEIVPPSVFHGLLSVAGWQAGRCEARETDPVKPVPDHVVEETLPRLSRTVASMVKLQLLTGMRPGELCSMRTCDIETTGKVWTYRPASHKTQHHGHERVVCIGPKAQEILRPFLRLDTQAFCFSPAEAEAERNAAKRAARKSPMTPSQATRVTKPDRLRPPGDRYDVEAYRKAIARGCDVAFPPPDHLRPALLPGGKRRESVRAFMARLTPEQKAELKRWRKLHRWHPHRLRHSAATRLRKEYGLEVARAVLGHQSAEITEVYAEMDTTKAIQVMGEVG